MNEPELNELERKLLSREIWIRYRDQQIHELTEFYTKIMRIDPSLNKEEILEKIKEFSNDLNNSIEDGSKKYLKENKDKLIVTVYL